MAKRKTIPSHIRPTARVTLIGAISAQPQCNYVPHKRTHVAKGVVEAGKQDIPVAAYGDVAETLGTLLAGYIVRIDGEIVTHAWKVGKEERQRAEVKVDKVETLWMPTKF